MFNVLFLKNFAMSEIKSLLVSRSKTAGLIFFVIVFVQFFSFEVFAQAKRQTKLRKKPLPKKTVKIIVLPKITQVDAATLKNLLKTNGKPLLVNFWATWCDPCREEFPDLVKIDADYGEKIDLLPFRLMKLKK